MRFIDSHLHLTDPKLLPDAEAIIKRALAAGVTRLVVICTTKKNTEEALLLQEKYPKEISLVAGTTPHEAATLGEGEFPYFEGLAREKKLVALGESGLDYYYEHSDRASQKALLHRYLSLAQELSMPLVIHCRDAFEDFFEILDQYQVKGVLHCFTGTLEEAKQVIKRGWYLSLSGIVTFKKSLELQEVAKIVPLRQLLIETDSPYLAPQSKRGKVNEPAYVVEVAQKIADLRGVLVEEIAEATAANAQALLAL